MKSILYGLLTVVSQYCHAQMISPQEAFNDIKLLSEILISSHPGLLRYQDIDQWDQAINKALVVEDSMSIIQFNYTIRHLLSKIQCGHTTSYLPRDVRRKRLYNDQILVPPFLLDWKKNRVMVSKFINADLPENVELVEINGHGVDSLIKNWRNHSFQGDASSPTRTPHFLVDEFHMFYYDFVGLESSYGLKVRYPNQEMMIEVINVESITAKEWREQRNETKEAHHQPWLNYNVSEDNIGYLRIRMFGDYELQNGEKGKFKKFINNTFKGINTAPPKALIIDLRENDGGEGKLGALLYSMIANEPFRYFTKWDTKVNSIPYEEHADISKIEKVSINGLLKKRLESTDDGYTVNSWYGTLSIQDPDPLSYQGPVYILVDGRTFSAASDFVAVAKSNHRAVIIGETTGGAYIGNNSGVTINYKLPNSKIRVQVPLAAGYNYVIPQNNYGGIIPDYHADPSDAMEIAYSLIPN